MKFVLMYLFCGIVWLIYYNHEYRDMIDEAFVEVMDKLFEESIMFNRYGVNLYRALRLEWYGYFIITWPKWVYYAIRERLLTYKVYRLEKKMRKYNKH